MVEGAPCPTGLLPEMKIHSPSSGAYRSANAVIIKATRLLSV
jgi:hypothetical protein